MDRDETELPPETFEALRSAIMERRADLPKRLTQVAAYALDNPDEIAFQTAAGVAEAANVQPSTLVRFAQLFGFDGFSSLQHLFRERLRGRTSSYEERLRLIESGSAAVPETAAILGGFAAAAHRSLDALEQSIDARDFEHAATILARAETIFLIAKRRSYPISAYMAYAFGKLGVKCTVVGTAAGIEEDMLALATSADAAFAISFSPYAPETASQARSLANRGVPVVSLTDTAFSPLAECSRIWFALSEADHAGFRSLSASMAFAMALTVSVAEKRRQKARRRLPRQME